MKFKDYIRNFIEALMSSPSVGGLQISSSAIRFLELKKKTKTGVNNSSVVRDVSIRLPHGIIDAGKIRDKEAFLDALKSVYSQTAKKKENINIVLTISAGEVYVEAFNMPNLGGKNLHEAIDLNMQMISPSPIDEAYYSWQIVGPSDGPVEVLGAFAPKSVIDEIVSILGEAGFRVVAIEFSTLSLVRNLQHLNILKIDEKLSYLALKITSDGIIFLVLRNNNLYFNYFRGWENLADENGDISLGTITDIIKTEVDKILNFHNSRWGVQMKEIILITPALQNEIASFIRKQYSTFNVQIADSSNINLHGVMGAALRGLKSRIEDDDINLGSLTTIQSFFRDQVLSFLSLWRNVFIAIGIFMVIVFVTVNILIGRYADEERSRNITFLQEREVAELEDLQLRAERFNSLVSLVFDARSKKQNIYPLLRRLDDSAGDRIEVEKLSIQSIGSVSTITGLAPDHNAVTAFKNRLLEIEQLDEVDAPLSSIIPQISGKTAFIINFKITSLNFE
ncbi:MAG TPA: pilus assembly protein PilM [Candidatus Paceibacterota bacterium]